MSTPASSTPARRRHSALRSAGGSLALIASMITAEGCIYPHRGTSLTPVRAGSQQPNIDVPSDIYQLTVVEALIVPQRRGALAWDDGDGLPDAFVRIYRGEDLIFNSAAISDTLTPEWNVTLPENVRIQSHDPLRIEVWDEDTLGSDPVGVMRRHGLPENAVPGVDARVLLEGGSYLTLRVAPPIPQRGVGISEYELRPDELVIVRVIPFSPASRADLVPGDRIVAIGDDEVSDLTDMRAASALSMAVRRGSRLRIRDTENHEREVELDQGYVWPTR